MEFNPSRMKHARIKCGFTLTYLASLLSVSSRTLSKYENVHETPDQKFIQKISFELNVPIMFLYQDDMPEIETDVVSFRSLARKKASQRDRALCSGQLAIELSNWINDRFSLPTPEIPDYRHLSPKAAAMALREEWVLGEKSITNMIHLLESKGIFVFSIYEKNREIDAFCFKYDSQPYIFLNKFKSAERSRFDAAHELGHLVLHQHGEAIGKEREKEADEFASVFLMPEASVRAQVVVIPTVERVISLKHKWKVSAAALLRRWYDLNMISEWVYRRLNVAFSKLGYLKSEPEGIEHERSQILDKILKQLWQEKITKQDIANDLHVYTSDIEALMFGIVANQNMISDQKRSEKPCFQIK